MTQQETLWLTEDNEEIESLTHRKSIMSLDEEDDGHSSLAANVEPDPKAYWRVFCDVILRTIFAVAILAVGCWIPEVHRNQIPCSYAATDPVLSLASLVSKVAASIFGVMACWSFRCMFELFWLDRIQQNRELSSE